HLRAVIYPASQSSPTDAQLTLAVGYDFRISCANNVSEER
ncbi:hypothetical protein FHR90_003324, partial [Endobacter medicaginis]|nr:hypothetical protein [Endobacter medicaginis]